MRFRRRELLLEAMTHASWNNEQGRVGGPGQDNERLEYLGDAVLELIVGEYLFRRFPGYDEGQLTQLRAALVNTLSLARLAEKLEIGDVLLVGKGAAKTGAHRLPSLLANAFEAMIGAIFLDQGYRVATRVFLQNIGDLADWGDENFKGRLQEAAQERTGQAPAYRVANIGGPGHRRLYSADALVGGEVVGTGTGSTKQAAEQAAARAALEALKGPRPRRRADTAGRAVAAARRAAGEAAGETPRSRRRIAEAAVDRDAAAAAARPRRRSSRASTADAAGALPTEVPLTPPPEGVARRRGFLATLRSAAEVLVGRRMEEQPAAVAAPPAQHQPAAAPAPPPAGTPTSPQASATAPPAVSEGEAGRHRTRRGRRGGRGRRRSAAEAVEPRQPPAESSVASAGARSRPRSTRPAARRERPQSATAPPEASPSAPPERPAKGSGEAAPGAPRSRRRRSAATPADLA